MQGGSPPRQMAKHVTVTMSPTPRAFSLDPRGIPGLLGATSPGPEFQPSAKCQLLLPVEHQVMSLSSSLCLWRSPCQTSHLGWGPSRGVRPGLRARAPLDFCAVTSGCGCPLHQPAGELPGRRWGPATCQQGKAGSGVTGSRPVTTCPRTGTLTEVTLLPPCVLAVAGFAWRWPHCS